MAVSAGRSTTRLAHLLSPICFAAPSDRVAAAGWPRSASGGGGGGGRAGDAKQRAVQYVKEKERQQRVSHEADAPSSSSSGSSDGPRRRLAEAAAEWSEGQQALFLSSPSGLGVGAEAAIAQAIKDGALDNLKGKGKPLPAEDHSAQFGRVDPLVAAVTRTMGAQGVKPLSLELRDEVHRDFAAVRSQLEQELRAALEAAGSPSERADSSRFSEHGSGSRSGSSRGGWFSSWFGGSSTRAGAAASAASPRQTVASIRAGQHPALQHAAEELRKLIQQYNNACLADKEAFGAFWPLDRMKQLDWQAEVEAALDRIGGSSGDSCGGGISSGGSGGSSSHA